MVKGWADVSSDEEDFMDEPDDVSTVAEDPVDIGELDSELYQSEAPPQPSEEGPAPPVEKKEFDWPDEPPYTAYVGNLAYSVDTPEKLGDEIIQLAQQTLGQEVNVVNVRLSKVQNHRGGGRENQQQRAHRGFAYVEFETLEQMKSVVEGLAGGKIGGRAITLDTANLPANRKNQFNNNNNNHSQVDGSKFRGGRHSSRRRQQNNSSSNDDGAQRTSLKLQPRSKPLDGDRFARPREESNGSTGTWQSRRDNERSGGRGRSGTRRSGGRDGRSRPARGGTGTRKEEKKPKTAEESEGAGNKPKKSTAVVNRFALLGVDSDSD